MFPSSSLHHHHRLLLLMLFLSSTTITICDYPTACHTRTCGNITISYPFWFEDVLQQTKNNPFSFCGYKNFTVYCSGGYPIVNLGEDNYTIKAIDYDQRTVKLADTDVLNTAGNCPRVRHNATVWDSESQFRYTDGDATLTFFFDCSSPIANLTNLPDLPTVLTPATCFSGGKSDVGELSYVLRTDVILWDVFYALKCDELVTVRVLESEQLREYSWLIGGGFGSALKNGFELGWTQTTADGCGGCEKSGGFCGYNVTSKGSYNFTCYCSDGAHSQNCGTTGNHTRTKIIVGFSSGAGTLVLALAVFLIWFRYKKQKYISASSSYYRSASSETPYKDPELGVKNLQTHQFSYEELQQATNFFDASKELGDGGFGTVYKGKLRDGRVVAVKRLYENNCKRVEQFINEVEILSFLQHPNLVRLYGCTHYQSRELLLVYEYISNGTVADHLHGPRAPEGLLTWPIRLSIAIEIADALSYLHAIDPPIIHRDVKSTNILLDGNFSVKVADFGLSRLFPTNATHVSTAPQGTPGYVDPEYHVTYQLTDKSDVYSFGVFLVELISSKPAVDITRKRSEINLGMMAINKIQSGELETLVDPGLGFKSDAEVNRMVTRVAELAFRCLQDDGEMRPPIKEVLEVLREIEGGAFSAKKDAQTEDETGVAENKKVQHPDSPTSVQDQWESRRTTPNNSG